MIPVKIPSIMNFQIMPLIRFATASVIFSISSCFMSLIIYLFPNICQQELKGGYYGI